MSADDTNLFFNNVSYTELLKKSNKELHKVDSWLTANKLTKNTKKTKVIALKTYNSPPVPPNLEIKLNKNALDQVPVTSIRFLGVTMHKHLTWKFHMELLLKKIRMGQGITQKVKPFLNCLT